MKGRNENMKRLTDFQYDLFIYENTLTNKIDENRVEQPEVFKANVIVFINKVNYYVRTFKDKKLRYYCYDYRVENFNIILLGNDINHKKFNSLVKRNHLLDYLIVEFGSLTFNFDIEEELINYKRWKRLGEIINDKSPITFPESEGN